MASPTGTDAGIGVIVVDETGVVTRWSPGAERLFAVETDEAIGASIRDLADWNIDNSVRKLYRGMRIGDVWVRDHSLHTREGRALSLRVTVARHLGADARPVTTACFDDSSPRDLTEATQSYPIRDILDGSEPLLFCNRRGLITHAAPDHLSLSGLQPADVLGRHPCDFLHVDDVEAWHEMWTWAMLEPVRTQSVLVRYRLDRGEYRWIEHRAINYFGDPAVASMVVHCRPGNDPSDVLLPARH